VSAPGVGRFFGGGDGGGADLNSAVGMDGGGMAESSLK